MPPSLRNTGILNQTKTEITGDAEKIDDSLQLAPVEHYHHSIPAFILRRFQVRPVRSRTERQKERVRPADLDPEYVHYYNIATSDLDIRRIREVYGVPDFYQDNRYALEEKLADLESQACSIIEDMHRALPYGTFSLKRTPLELLRKFLFIFHYRDLSCSGNFFEVDPTDNSRRRHWIEHFVKAKGIQSAVETWLYFLGYYLDKSHSDIMRDAVELLEKHGSPEGAELHVPSDLERYPAVAYHAFAKSYFLSIWEAAEGEEFILTHNGFGLHEGLAGDCPGVHRIFVVSPRIAIVLRHVLLGSNMKSSIKMDPLKSTLLSVDLPSPTVIYASREDSIDANIYPPRSHARYTSSQTRVDDTFGFKITKLSRHSTLELNFVVLGNVKRTGSLIFLSRESMLHTARALRSSPSNLPERDLLAPLIQRLITSMGTDLLTPDPPSYSLLGVPDEDYDALSFVDEALYVLLMQICTGRKHFPSAYDRAHIILEMMEKAKPTSLAHKIDQEVGRAFQACKEDSEDVGTLPMGISFPPLLPSIPNELSSQLFRLMIPYMSTLGAVMSEGEGILEELQNEVVVVSFLTRASCSPDVWHTLSCSNREVPEILAKLFKDSPQRMRFAEPLRNYCTRKDHHRHLPVMTGHTHCEEICGMAGPTTNTFIQSYYEIASAITGWLSLRDAEFPEATILFAAGQVSHGPARSQYAKSAFRLADEAHEDDSGGIRIHTLAR